MSDQTDAANRWPTSTPTRRHAGADGRRSTAEPGSAKPDPILVVDNIVRQFGGMTAVDVDHLEVQRGIITALIGPNGAGKTTFFNLITGFDKPSSAKRAPTGPSTAASSTRPRPRASRWPAWSAPSSSPRRSAG